MHDLAWYALQEAQTNAEYALARLDENSEDYNEIREIAEKLKIIVEKNNR